MAQPAARVDSARSVADAARRLETPSEVRHFEALAAGSDAGRAFLATPEWAAIHERIVGNGQALYTVASVGDLGRLFRLLADGPLSVEPPSAEQRAAYLHAAVEAEALDRRLAHNGSETRHVAA